MKLPLPLLLRPPLLRRRQPELLLLLLPGSLALCQPLKHPLQRSLVLTQTPARSSSRGVTLSGEWGGLDGYV